MTKSGKRLTAMLLAGLMLLPGIRAEAKVTNTIEAGVYIGEIDVSGKTAEEAKQAVTEYIEGLKSVNVTILAADQNEVKVTAGDLGLVWKNEEAAQEAAAIGKTGNIVQRYKALQDLKHENKIFDLVYDFDKELIRQVIIDQCMQYDVEAIDATLSKGEAGFSVTAGQAGYVTDEQASADKIYEYLTNEWTREAISVELVIKEDEPRGTEEELSKVTDVLGTFTTGFKSSGASRSANVINGCNLVAGSILYPGDEFSMYEAVAPFTTDNGYYMAGSYLNGQVVDSLGGGICQVSTTLYNAVLLAELEVTERHNHSMIVSYVDPSADAAISESAGKDFRFVNNTDTPVYIDGTASDKNMIFTIYGVEKRSANRQIKYESEVLSVINPDAEIINTNPAIPIGQVSVQSAHIGYKARLWKVVTENGTEVSREQVNSSNYKMVPRTAMVGLSTNDVNAYNEMLAAVATNSIDHVKNVGAALAAAAAAQQAAAQPQEPAPPQEQAPPPPPAEETDGGFAEE